jgi:signal transduction histidine kinase
MPTHQSLSDTEQLLMNVLHDLRQPLGNIELTAYHLHLILGEPKGKALEQIRTIEAQVERASGILTEAAGALVRLRTQREASPSLPLTNAASPALT